MYAGFSILIAALIAALFFKQGVWLQHRAQILSIYVVFSLAVDYQSVDVFRIIPTYTESALYTVSIIAFIFNVGAFVFMIYTSIKAKKNPLKQEIYTDTKYYQKSIEQNNLI
jgi:hypothetical protein